MKKTILLICVFALVCVGMALGTTPAQVVGKPSIYDNWDTSVYEDRLVGFWRMDNESSVGENDTVAFDWSGVGNNGSVTNASLVNGQIANAYDFNGTTDYITVPFDNSLNFTRMENFSILFWFNVEDNPSSEMILGKSFTTPIQIEVNVNSLRFFYTNVSNNEIEVSSQNIIQSNEWYFGAVTFETGGNVTLYVNNTIVKEVVTSGSLENDTGANLCIGGRGSSCTSNNFNGSIDEFMIFNRSLSDSEILDIYNQQKNNQVIAYEDMNLISNTTLLFDTYTLNDSNGNGAIILNDDIILDCNGATIVSGGFQGGWALEINTKNNVTIKNCNVDGRGEMVDRALTVNWTETATNIWKFSDPTVPRRVFLNDTEYSMSRFNTTLNTSDRWFANSTSGFYVYATSNPANAYDSIKEPMYLQSLRLRHTSNITLENVNLSGAFNYAILVAGSSNTTVHSSEIGLWSRRAIHSISDGAFNSTNNLYYNNTFDSGHNLQNDWNTEGINDGIHFDDGTFNNTVRDSTFINWGHVSIYIDAFDLTGGARFNKIHDISIVDNGNTFNRGLSIDGCDGCAEFNEMYDINITNTSVRNQLNGNNNSFYRIIIDEMKNNLNRIGVTGVGTAQGISVHDFGGANVARDNTFINITISNIDEACIRIVSNATGHIFRNLNLTNCARNSIQDRTSYDILLSDTAGSSTNITASFIDGTVSDGTFQYRFIDDKGNITINETSTSFHNITLPNNGFIKFNYNGRKDFRVENNRISIVNMVSPYNDIKNATSGLILATNQDTFNITVAPNHEIQVGDFTLSISNIAVSGIAEAAATITWTTTELSNTTVNYGTTSGNLNLISETDNSVTSHSRTLLSLTNDITYYYNITSCDASGNCVSSTQNSFTTDSTTRSDLYQFMTIAGLMSILAIGVILISILMMFYNKNDGFKEKAKELPSLLTQGMLTLLVAFIVVILVIVIIAIVVKIV